MPKAVLIVTALIFIGFGVAFAGWPSELMSSVGVQLVDATARSEIRGFYGGLEIGFGLFLFLCSRDRAAWKWGLLAAAISLGSIALFRAGSAMLDPPVASMVWIFFAVEFFGAFVNGVYFLKAKRGAL